MILIPISHKTPERIIPSYNLTGDLLTYLNCGLRYRYYHKGSIPPSRPVQLWFGQFIHGVMEEAYLKWSSPNPEHRRFKTFPWDWNSQIRDLELTVNKRLVAQGISVHGRIFCQETRPSQYRLQCPDTNHPHQLLASERTEAAINTWGPSLFELIDKTEIKLTGIRPMSPTSVPGAQPRANYYEINGIIDVLSSVNLNSVSGSNLIVQKINQIPNINNFINQLPLPDYEVIVDYKGMRRSSQQSLINQSWNYHEWQILTYAWLRMKQTRVSPLIGILFYLNELFPSESDILELQRELSNPQYSTDVPPQLQNDIDAIINYNQGDPVPSLSAPLKTDRSIRLIIIDQNLINNALQQFNSVVEEIENCVIQEIRGQPIQGIWRTNPADYDSCTTCDWKSICPNPNSNLRRRIIIP